MVIFHSHHYHHPKKCWTAVVGLTVHCSGGPNTLTNGDLTAEKASCRPFPAFAKHCQTLSNIASRSCRVLNFWILLEWEKKGRNTLLSAKSIPLLHTAGRWSSVIWGIWVHCEVWKPLRRRTNSKSSKWWSGESRLSKAGKLWKHTVEKSQTSVTTTSDLEFKVNE